MRFLPELLKYEFLWSAVAWVNVYTIYFVHAVARLSTMNIYQDIDGAVADVNNNHNNVIQQQ